MANKAASVLSETISFLTRATLAVTEVEETARAEVAKSAAEANTYRRERDDAQNALHASQREAHAAKLEVETWRVKAEQSEMLLNNQREMTETARREAEQWKTQSQRQEEARARQEEALLQQINDWREQYRQVERERLRISTKLEELMHQSKQSYTPRLAPPLDVISSSSVGTKISLLHHADHSPTAVAEQDPNESISNLGTRARRHSIAQPPFKASGGFSRREPAQVQLIRRVRAVVDFPVKEEEDDDGGMGVESAGIFTPGSYVPASSVPVASTASPTSASEEEQAPERRAPRRSGVAHTVTRSGRAVHQSPWMPTDGTAGGGEAHYGDTSPEEDNDGAVGEEFTEAKAREHSAKKRKKTPRRAVAPAVDPLYMDEDDDELTIGAEKNHHELYGSQRVDGRPSGRSRPRKSTGKSSTTKTTGTKRKAPSDTQSGERAQASNKAKRWVEV